MNPLVIDLFCGLGGWAEGFLAEGYSVVGFDIERWPYPGQLVLQDVRTLHGSQFKNAVMIVASPPCNEYSYRAMPWKRAKALPPPDNSLFEACFRIQREASEAAGHHIPMIVENVRGAQKWVGRARWNFGSFYLWGDVPALMPMTAKRGVMKAGIAHRSDGATNFHGYKSSGLSGQKTVGHVNKRDGHSHTRHLTNQREHDGVKVRGNKLSENGFTIPIAREIDKTLKPDSFKLSSDDRRQHLSYSRKAASAMIAKIPFSLAQYIARVFA